MKLSDKEKLRLKTKYGEWAIVSGASSGIGLELTNQLADAGFNLVVNARNLDKLKSIEQDLKSKHNIQIKIVDADISETSGIEKIIQATQGLNVGLFIASAGYGTSGSFVDASLHGEINMLRVNCEALLSLTHYFCQKFVQ